MMNVFFDDLEWDNMDTSDSEDQDGSESAYYRQAQSILSGMDESIGKIDDFLIYERGFMHGEVVCSVKDPSGQWGRIVNVDMTVDLETTFGEMIKGINSKNLLRLRSFACGDYVVQGPWIGRVNTAIDKVTVMFGDGTSCEIMMEDSEVLVSVSSVLFEDAPYPYYPGQPVRVKLPANSKSVQWLSGSSKSSQDEGIVSQVQVGLVHVNWISTVTIVQGVIPSAPPHAQDPDKLTLLSCSPHINWQLGDWCILPASYFHSEQIMGAKKSLSSSIASQCFARMKKVFRLDDEYHKQIYVIAKTDSKVDVLWQDGSQSLGIDSQTLLPVNNVSEHDFWPEQFVLEKAISENIHVSNGQRLGIVKYVHAVDRTVKVKWMATEIKLDVHLIGESNEEIVSAYELIEHPDYSYCIGDIVFKLIQHFEILEDELLGAQTKGQSLMGDVSVKGIRNDTYIKEIGHEVTCYLSYIGSVIGVKDASIEVRWANGVISKVQPSEIFGLDKLDGPPLLPVVNEESVPEMITNKMADQGEIPCLKKEQDINVHGEDCNKDVWGARLFSQAAAEFLTNVSTSIFTSQEIPAARAMIGFVFGQWKEESEFQVLKAEELELDIDNIQPDNMKNKSEAKMDGLPITPPSIGSLKFKQFDIADDYSEHHFVNGISERYLSPQIKRSWLKKVQQEWNILRKNLPESIYVRVYEARIDILRACIVGSPGTPYHDGLFFFDIFLPPDYPQEPPLVHYNSGGLRLNPNLYESGKVCLSLLKTWTGSGTEVWDPESSTILQVLVSLQALVLNDKPYFNEAGYDNQIGRAGEEKNSIAYNENAFLLSCKSMLYIIHRPPKNFEALVEEHFAHRSHHIVCSYKAYMLGAQVGCAVKDGKVGGEGSKSSSTGFKIMLEKLFPKLISALTEKRTDCSLFSNGSIKICDPSKTLD